MSYKCLGCGEQFNHGLFLDGKQAYEVNECFKCKPIDCSGYKTLFVPKYKGKISYKEDFQEQKIADDAKEKEIIECDKKSRQKLKKIINDNAKKIGIL
jgi:DNA-directed RNA polymerase subunit RPC12/RpoP